MDENLLRRARAAVVFSYEAGDYPPMDPDVEEFVAGDGGLLHALDLAITSAAAIARVRALHVARRGMAGCRECGYDLPCDTLRALDGTDA